MHLQNQNKVSAAIGLVAALDMKKKQSHFCRKVPFRTLSAHNYAVILFPQNSEGTSFTFRLSSLVSYVQGCFTRLAGRVPIHKNQILKPNTRTHSVDPYVRCHFGPKVKTEKGIERVPFGRKTPFGPIRTFFGQKVPFRLKSSTLEPFRPFWKRENRKTEVQAKKK